MERFATSRSQASEAEQTNRGACRRRRKRRSIPHHVRLVVRQSGALGLRGRSGSPSSDARETVRRHEHVGLTYGFPLHHKPLITRPVRRTASVRRSATTGRKRSRSCRPSSLCGGRTSQSSPARRLRSVGWSRPLAPWAWSRATGTTRAWRLRSWSRSMPTTSPCIASRTCSRHVAGRPPEARS